MVVYIWLPRLIAQNFKKGRFYSVRLRAWCVLAACVAVLRRFWAVCDRLRVGGEFRALKRGLKRSLGSAVPKIFAKRQKKGVFLLTNGGGDGIMVAKYATKDISV